jgi:hypothetical protein
MTVQDLLIELGLDFDSKAFDAADKALLALKGTAAGVVAAVGAVGAGLVAAAGYTAKTADNVDELAQSLGVSTDALQRLAYAAGFSGLSIDNVGLAIKHLAKQGSKDALGDMLNLADTFQRMPDGTKKTALAIEKLGRQGASMIPMLNEGREKLEELFAEAPVLNPETIRSGVELSDAITRIQGALKKVVFMLGAPLLKPLGRVATALTKWFNANEDIIKSKVTAFVEGFAKAAEAVGSVLSRLWFILDNLATALGGWGRVLTAATAGLAVFGIAVNAPIAALGLFLLMLDDVFGYFEGKDSVTGDLVAGWEKLWDRLLNPSWKDSEIVMFFQSLVRLVQDAEAHFDQLIAKVQGRKTDVRMTNAEIDDNRSFAESYAARVAAGEVQAPIVGRHDVSGGRPVLSKSEKNTLTVNVNGAGDPAATGQKVKEAIMEFFEPVEDW